MIFNITRLLSIGLLCGMATAAPAVGQGVQTAVLTGTLTSEDGAPLPGVTVTVTSAALQLPRVTVTDINGIYTIRALPSGVYAVTFALDGFQPASRTDVTLSVGGMTAVDAALPVLGRSEFVTVTAEAPSILVSPSTGRTVSKGVIDALPVGRRPVDVAELAPGLTANTFNAGQLSISGGFGYDNLFMVNGVDTNDNVFGTQNTLFIEDAVAEVSVLTAGIPAEYGRFSGGVVNVITRSGGNTISGSFRQNLSNPAWIAETPRQRQNNIEHAGALNTAYEGTVGGPVVRDHLWFFTAGRYEKANLPGTFTQTAGAYTRVDTNKRGEIKLTGTPAAGQTVQLSYIANATSQANTSGIPASRLVDASVLVTRTLPNNLLLASYDGELPAGLFGSARVSRKNQGFRRNGGTSTAIMDSPFRTVGATPGVPPVLFYHAPYLDATDPENRDNHQIAASVSRLLSTRATGTHDLKGGVESFVSTAIGGNSQSSTGWVFATDYAVADGRPVLGATGRPVPVFTPGVSQAWNFQATRGAQLDIRTTSLYVQDHWIATDALTIDVGVRAEIVRGRATGDVTTVDTAALFPRLAAVYDLRGDGRTVLQGSYGIYSGRYGQTQFGANTTVGRPGEVDYVYSGPAGQGSDFAPGFDLANYTRVAYANVPTANIQMADGLTSPRVSEFTGAIGHAIGNRGHGKATYVWRRTSRFIEDFVDLGNGVVDVPLVGTLTNRVFRNTDTPTREYAALILESTYRPLDSVVLFADYTAQLRNHGTFAGEATSQPGIPSVFGDFPEIYGGALDRLMPYGRFDGYQRHKLRVSAVVMQSLGRFGALDIAPLWRVNSGTAYSLTASIPVPQAQLARDPGYPANDIHPFLRETVFFGERGGETFKGYGVVDLAVTYRVPVWRTLAPWAKVEVFNALNNQKQIAWDRTVRADPSSPLDSNGIPTGFLQGPRFGQVTTDNQYPQPYLGQNGGRAVRLAFGVRL